MGQITKVPLVLQPAEEGGWTVISPIIPELITEIDDLGELEEKLKDALEAVKELYHDMSKPFPGEVITDIGKPLWFETLVSA